MRDKGNKGEEIACTYLEQNDYSIINRNFRFKRGEIDIVAKKDGLLCFIEVKLRSRSDFGEPEEFVSQNQQNLILRTAEEFIDQVDWQNDIRFDIVAIKKLGETLEIEHLKDAFH